MKKIFNCIKSLFNKKKQDNASPSIIITNDSYKSNNKIVNVTSKRVGNTTEFSIELNEEVFLNELKDESFGSGKAK